MATISTRATLESPDWSTSVPPRTGRDESGVHRLQRYAHSSTFGWPLDPWHSTWTLFNVDGAAHRPALRLEVASHRRARLMQHTATIAWMGVAPSLYEAAIRWSPCEMSRVLPPIARSVADEHAAARSKREWFERWMRWFVTRLETANGPFDYGSWVLRPGRLADYRRQSLPLATSVENAAVRNERSWSRLGWTLDGGDYLVPQRRLPHVGSGRVKALRKLAREGTLPPLLVWPIEAFGVHVLLDGHARLSAAIAERTWPDVILVHSARIAPGRRSSEAVLESARRAAYEELEQSNGRDHRAADAWAAAHDDRPWIPDRTHAYAWRGGRDEWAAALRDDTFATGDSGGIAIAREVPESVALWL